MTKLFADTANLHDIGMLLRTRIVHGVTTNPTIMRSIGVADNKYLFHSQSVAELAKHYETPVSLEVVADDHTGMSQQARRLAKLGDNVFVKLPVTNTHGEWTADLAVELLHDGIPVNVTAVMNPEQMEYVSDRLAMVKTPFIVSVFAGRIADTGRDPEKFVGAALDQFRSNGYARVLWASVREIYNFHQAERVGCDIITMRPDLIRKMWQLHDQDLGRLSLDTVRQFYRDGKAAGFEI